MLTDESSPDHQSSRSLEVMAYGKNKGPKVACVREQSNAERHRGLTIG